MTNAECPNINGRKEFPMLIDRLGFKVGAEVGVDEGKFSYHLLSHSKLDMLFSIDPWLDIDGKFMDGTYQKCKTLLAPFVTRNTIMIMTGNQAAQQIPDGSLDFVYIDANHSYEAAKDDITTWYEKVKVGGVLAGHDYKNCGRAVNTGNYNPPGAGERCRVKRAVNEFANLKGIIVKVLYDLGSGWWFIKD